MLGSADTKENMKKEDEKIIMYDSPEAASIQTVTGWVSSTGHFWGNDEHMARVSGSTHKTCAECGYVYRNNAWCKPCRSAKQREKFNAMPVVEWDGETPLNLYGTDQYFFDDGDVLSYAEDNEAAPETLDLVLCCPHNPSDFDANDWLCDYLAEDMGVEDVSDEVCKAVDVLNAAVKSVKAFSWLPDNKRVIVSGNR